MDEGFPILNPLANFGFAITRILRDTCSSARPWWAPPRRGPSCDCTYQSDPWCVCTDRESGADYESADSPHFLPSDLLEGLRWADWWTAVGVGLSSERPRWRQSLCPQHGRLAEDSPVWLHFEGEGPSCYFIIPRCSDKPPTPPPPFTSLRLWTWSQIHFPIATFPLFVCAFEICNIIQYAKRSHVKSHRASIARPP